MKLAVTGTTGQLVRALSEIGALRGAQIVAIGRPTLDLADPASLAPALATAFADGPPDAVIAAAAYTAVDRAEQEADLVHAVNVGGAAALAAAARELGVPLVHLSTDYVFDGAKGAPYREADATAPTGVYGASKLASEAAVLAEHPAATILRTSWLYSPFGANFVRTMLRLAATDDEIGVVDDQRGNPTSALDLAEAVLRIAARLVADPDPGLRGIFHVAGSGEASWADLAQMVFATSAARGGPAAIVRRITSAEYPMSASRPADARLDCGKLAATYGIRLPRWRGSVEAVVARMLVETRGEEAIGGGSEAPP